MPAHCPTTPHAMLDAGRMLDIPPIRLPRVHALPLGSVCLPITHSLLRPCAVSLAVCQKGEDMLTELKRVLSEIDAFNTDLLRSLAHALADETTVRGAIELCTRPANAWLIPRSVPTKLLATGLE